MLTYDMGSQSYISIHQNGSTILAAAFSTIPSTGVSISFINGQHFVPQRVDVSDVFFGQLFGNTVTLSGETAYGACNASFTVSFNGATANFTRNFFSNTPAGTAQGFNCSNLFQAVINAVGRSGVATRVF